MRALRGDDADALHPILSDAALMTWWSSAPQASVETTRDYITPRASDGPWRSWAITLDGSDTAIGWVSAGLRRAKVIELGYLLGRAHWGGGIAREAASGLLDYLFEVEGMRRVFADIDPDNRGSVALIEALGFKLEGVLREEWETHIGVRDSAIYGLLAREWAQRQH
ncbi:GNAT family N-acetyltransferase [Sphingomonas japonica]